MKTEKISVNLSPVELGQIDYLVGRGLFDSRSDFMRSAARKALERYEAEIRLFISPEHHLDIEAEGKSRNFMFSLGVLGITKNEVARMIKERKKTHIRVIGVFVIPAGITPGEICQVVASCKVYGKIAASKEVIDVLKEIEKKWHSI